MFIRIPLYTSQGAIVDLFSVSVTVLLYFLKQCLKKIVYGR